ncbi:MAG: PAS domain S-box protein [Gemmatimonadota bacterium]
MTTRQRLWLAFGAQAALLVGSVGTIAVLLVGIRQQSEELIQSRARSAAVREIEINVLGFAAAIGDFAQLGDTDLLVLARQEALGVDSAFAEYAALATSAARQGLATEFARRWQDLRARGESLMTLPPSGDTGAEWTGFSLRRREIEAHLDEAMQPEALEAFNTAVRASRQLSRNTLATAGALLVLGFLISIASAHVVERRIVAGEREVTRHRSRLLATFEAMQDGVAVFDLDGNLVEANQALATMHGYDEAGDMRRHLSGFAETFEVFGPIGEPLALPQWPASRVLAGETFTNLELRLRRPDNGFERLLSYNARPASRNEQNAVAVMVVRDITDSARARRLFDEQSHLLASIFDAAPALIFVKDRAGRFVVANRAVAELYGTTPENLVGRSDADFNPNAAEIERFVGNDVDVIDSKRPKLIAEEPVTSPDRGTRWFQTIKVPLSPPGSAETLVLGISSDITDRKNAEEARAASDERFRLLLESMPDAVLVVDESGAIVFASSKSKSLFDYEPEELIGREVELLIPAASEREHRSPRHEYMVAQEPRHVGGAGRELEARRRDGSTIPVEVSLSPVRTPDGVLVMCIVRDISARKALEDQLRQAQKMEAVGQLTGGIAHDLNNVLTVIIANGEMISNASRLPDEELKQDLADLLAAAKRGSLMIQRLLHFSRRAPLALQRVRPGTIIEGLTPMLRRLLPESIQVEVRDSTDPFDEVNGDAGAIEQMVVNLCTNARDAMPESGLLRIDTERAELDAGYYATHPWVEPGPYVVISVADNGSGMDEQTKDRIFEPFFTTKAVSKGTGLGMAMVYGTIKQHKGMVHVYSEIGRGTTIKLYFPLVASQDVLASAPADEDHDRGALEGEETILLAEDEPAIRRTTARALRGRGYTVLIAADGEEALELYRDNRARIALVISDLIMPKLGGRQLAEALRGEGATVPVLFTSGYSPDSAAGWSQFPEGVAFLQKPWTLKDLLGRVRALLDANGR